MGPGARPDSQDQRPPAGTGPRVGQHHADHDHPTSTLDEEQRRRRIEEDKGRRIETRKALGADFSKRFAISYIEAAKMANSWASSKSSSRLEEHHSVRRTRQEHHRLGHGEEARRTRAGDYRLGRADPGGARRGPDRRGLERLRPVDRRPVERERLKDPRTAMPPPTPSRTREHRRSAAGRRVDAEQLPGQPALHQRRAGSVSPSATSRTRFRST